MSAYMMDALLLAGAVHRPVRYVMHKVFLIYQCLIIFFEPGGLIPYLFEKG